MVGTSADAELEAGYDPKRTGYFKPLPTSGRVARVVSSAGLTMGQRMARIVRDDHVYLILMAAVVGVTSGAAAGLLLAWISTATSLFPTVDQEGSAWLRYLVLVGVPMLGGLLVGVLRMLLERYERKPPGVETVMHAVAERGKLDGPAAAGLGLGAGLTIGSGGSAGHEGPTMAIGATVGSVVSRFFGLRLRRQISMVGAGSAAGLASAFNAPLGGVIFTVEVLFRRSVGGNVGTMSVFLPLVVAAVAGTMTSHAIFGARTEFEIVQHVSYSIAELPFYLVVAGLAGLLSVGMNRLVIWSMERFEQLPGPAWLRPGLGGLGVGLLGALTFTELLGPGRGTVASALAGELLWTVALGLIALKIIATALTLGSQGMGGLFMPSLVIGACIGAIVQPLGELVLPGGSGVGAYALIGMGAMLGAFLRAPITPVVMLFELTHDYGLILPVMFAAILATFIANKIERDSLFDLMLRRHGVDPMQMGDVVEGAVMKRGRVGDLMVEPDHMLRADSGFDEVQRAALVEHLPTLYVVDEEDRVLGFIDTSQLAAMTIRGEIPHEACAIDLMSEHRPDLLVAEDTLAGAMLAMSRSRRNVLPVCDEDRHLLGLIYRHDLISHYSFNVLERQDEDLQLRAKSGAREEVSLGEGVTVERMVVGRNWAGQTLAELDLRRKTGVQVVEWRRGEILLPIDPHVPLREADVLALVGNRDALLDARWA